MRAKIPQLEEAFVGHFTGHHGFLLTKMLARIDALSLDIADLDTKIEAQLAPFANTVARLDEIPGVGATTAAMFIAEVGLDMTRFPTPAHLSSWARFPQESRSPPAARRAPAPPVMATATLPRSWVKQRSQQPGPTRSWASVTGAFARRRGKKKAIVAVGRSILLIVLSLLSDPQTRYHDLGPGFYDSRINPERMKRNHIRQLEALFADGSAAPTSSTNPDRVTTVEGTKLCLGVV
jgi:hypothetical protein